MPTRNKFMMAFPLEYLLLHLSGANAKKPQADPLVRRLLAKRLTF
jgi:hypothetical protein